MPREWPSISVLFLTTSSRAVLPSAAGPTASRMSRASPSRRRSRRAPSGDILRRVTFTSAARRDVLGARQHPHLRCPVRPGHAGSRNPRSLGPGAADRSRLVARDRTVARGPTGLGFLRVRHPGKHDRDRRGIWPAAGKAAGAGGGVCRPGDRWYHAGHQPPQARRGPAEASGGGPDPAVLLQRDAKRPRVEHLPRRSPSRACSRPFSSASAHCVASSGWWASSRRSLSDSIDSCSVCTR